MFFGAVTAERSAKLILVRGHTQFGSQWRLQAGETGIGRSHGMVLFPDDGALAERHARLVFRGMDLFLEPAPSTNGVFVRLRAPVRLVDGDEFIVGQQRLRLLRDDERPRAVPPPPADTKLLGSAVRAATTVFALARITPDPTQSEVYVRSQRLLTLGRTHCDVNFPVDGFVSERHAQLTHEGSHVLLEDLKSRNGTYVRVNAPWKLAHGDLLLLGEQVLRVELQR
jgi:pSer/pThr/pTyr-binding forkhead associated (FHA) protein